MRVGISKMRFVQHDDPFVLCTRVCEGWSQAILVKLAVCWKIPSFLGFNDDVEVVVLADFEIGKAGFLVVFLKVDPDPVGLERCDRDVI
jgi:hypothetical protein